MKIIDVVCSAGKTGFFFDDQKAIKTSAVLDGQAYFGKPVTEGFSAVRQSGESISVMFVLENGEIAYGDCAAVQYSGASGRDPLFLAENFIPVINKEIAPLYKGKEISSFKEMAKLVDDYVCPETGKQFHTALRYGVTQACLDAVAKSKKKLMAQIVADEYGTVVSDKMIPLFSQSGDERYSNTDKMILKGSQVLPHALFNNTDKVGENGIKLAEYVEWLSNRIVKLRQDSNYQPVLHIDVYGNLGPVFNYDFEKIAVFCGELEEKAKPFHLRVEGPVDMGERQKQIDALRDISAIIDKKGINVEIVADEWCNTLQDVIDFTDAKAGHMAQVKTPDLGGINNTIEAILYCKKHGMGAYQGGTCNETDRSGQVCAHIGMAISPVQMLAKPGMGVDEGFMIIYNEMSRILALKDII